MSLKVLGSVGAGQAGGQAGGGCDPEKAGGGELT